MALKDSIKHFRDVDNYNTYVEKKDIDDNFDLLADNVDTKADKTIVGIVTDGTTLKQQNNENRLAIGTDCESSVDFSYSYGNTCTASGGYSQAFGNNCVANNYYSQAFGYTCTASGNYSQAFGYTCTASGDYSYSYGADCKSSGVFAHSYGSGSTASGYFSFAYGSGSTASGNFSFAYGGGCKSSGNFSFAYGSGFENKQDISKSIGINGDGVTKQNLKHINYLKTTDETQTDFNYPIKLWIKSLNYITIKCEAIKDDYSTKWIFERKLIVLVDENGNVTIDSDDNTDIVKDDTDWAFDITSTNDSENPTLTLKATGKADTTIAWGIEVENRQTYFVG